MTEDEEDELLRTFKQVNRRRRNRDQWLLRSPKMSAMNLMADGFKEWILQESKDLLEIAEALKNSNKGIANEVDSYELRIRKIQKTYMKKVIVPMRKLEKGGSIALNEEEEHCRKFRIALDNVFGVVLEMREIRSILDGITVALFSVQTQKAESQKYIS